MSDFLSVGVIGVGAFGERHLAAYARQPRVTIVGVADSDVDRAQAVAARWGVQWFADGTELIAACRPAAVSVVTPGQHHLEPTLAALAHGCAVLLEKPIGMSSAEVAAIGEAVARTHAFVVPAHILRFAAPYREMQARVRRGAVGQVLGVSARRERGRDHEWLFPAMHPALMTLVHDIDLALWMTGARASRVSAQQRGGGGATSALLVWAQVEATDGSVWSLRTSWVLPEGAGIADRLEIFGTEGAAVLELQPNLAVFTATVDARDTGLNFDATLEALDTEVNHFCSCVRAGTASDIITLQEASDGILIAEAIIASAKAGGTPVEIST
jgi:predicted dehydrogenase